MQEDGNWLTLVEYSHVSRISISTLRRMIKKNELKFREENGRYLIESKITHSNSFKEKLKSTVKKTVVKFDAEMLQLEKANLTLKFKLKELEGELKKLLEENQELTMLVSIYEEKISELQSPRGNPNTKTEPPRLPPL